MKNNFMLSSSVDELPQNHQFNGIDVIKFLCSYMVCIIHISPFHAVGGTVDGLNFYNTANFYLQSCLCRIAVPFYFTASGFLLFRKIDFSNVDMYRIKRYSLKNIQLLGIWTFLLFVGSKGHLWYLGALVLAVVVLSMLIKKGISLKFITIFSIIAFAIGLIGDSYYGFIDPLKKHFITKLIIIGYDNLFFTTRNGIFFGLIFVLMGALFSKKRIVINNLIAIIGLIASIIVMLFEVYLLKTYSHPRDYNMLISLLPVTFFLFYIATHLNLKNRGIYTNLRTIGVIIFFSHMCVRFFVGLAFKILTYRFDFRFDGFIFLTTICLTTIFAVIVTHLSKKDGLTWLRYLYQ